MRVPRIRVTVRGMMIATASVALCLACLANVSFKNGCGGTAVLLTFRVVDDRDGMPIAGASVEYGDDVSALKLIVTDAAGEASTSFVVGSTSYTGPFLRQYRHFTYTGALQVKAPDCRPMLKLLGDFTRDPAFHDTSSPPPIVVRMTRGPVNARAALSER